MKAIVLLSGGLDSAVAAAVAKKEGFNELHCITFDYGQLWHVEMERAKQLVRWFQAERHLIFELPNLFKHPAFIPKDRVIDDKVAPTYIPLRNAVFLIHAAVYAEYLNINDIFIGAHQVDYSGYPDCRRVFLGAMETALHQASKRYVEGEGSFIIHAPLLHYSKTLIVTLGHQLGVPFELTWSCYDPQEGKPCKHCDACLIRKEAFDKALLTDPLIGV